MKTIDTKKTCNRDDYRGTTRDADLAQEIEWHKHTLQ